MINLFDLAKKDNPEILSYEDVCVELQITMPTLYAWIKKSGIEPKRLVNGTPYLEKNDLSKLVLPKTEG